MPRPALRIFAALAAVALPAAAATGIEPHLDPGVVIAGCDACHRGHGVTRSPMLPAGQSAVCLRCHESRAGVDAAVSEGALAADVRPTALASALAQPFRHPLDEDALSGLEPGAVTCTSCHSPHRGMAEDRSSDRPLARRKLSPRDPSQFEFELCQGCHGSAGVTTQSLLDISRLTNPNNRSYHPIEAPALDRSPSVIPELSGKEINCSDCHGNSDPSGARGPHGSAVAYLLRQEYVTVDGNAESAEAFALCYRCHDRERILDGSSFPGHRDHIVDERAACSTCHSAHGAVDNRALVRFGEETFIAGVGPSAEKGRLEFVSLAPGSGTCYLTCHGVDHAPLTYGDLEAPDGEAALLAPIAGGAPRELPAIRPPLRRKVPKERPVDP